MSLEERKSGGKYKPEMTLKATISCSIVVVLYKQRNRKVGKCV